MISLKIYDGGDDEDDTGDEKTYVVKIPKIPQHMEGQDATNKSELPYLHVYRRETGTLRIHDPEAEVDPPKEKKDLTEYVLMAWLVFSIWFSKLISDFWECFEEKNEDQFLR